MAEISLRKQPIQPRSRATCRAIEQATAQILMADGTAALTTNAIAERAGVSIGTLYQYYPSKEAIVAELIRAMRADMLADLRGAVPEKAPDTAPDSVPDSVPARADLAALVRDMIDASLAHHRRDPPLAQALEQAETALNMEPETAALKTEIHAVVATTLTDIGIAEPDLAARDLAALTRGMAQSASAAGERDFDALAARITRAALGYLSGGGADTATTATAL